MRPVYRIAIALAILVLALATAGSALGARPGAAPSPAAASAPATDGPAGPRKLPPPQSAITPAPGNPNYRPFACVAPVVNASQRTGNEDESFVVINRTNPNNIVAFSNLATANSIFRAYTMDGGTTWTRGTVATNVACCDGQAVFDSFGNLFLVYINGAVNQINLIVSTDGGATFSVPISVGNGSVDQPSIAVGNGSVWIDWNSSGNMVARGAPVTGLGVVGVFGAQQSIPSASGSFGGIAVGPGPNGGKVMVTYQSPTGGQGPATIYVNADVDGLGAGGFGARVAATTTNVGGFDFIPAQSGRSIDAEAGLVWDATGGPFNNRAYLIYTEEPVNESNDTEIYLRTSTDDGATWSAPARVNDDPLGLIRSQFLPYISLDPTSGTVAAGWHDARNDNGVPGSGGTNSVPNDDAEYYASYSTNGGVTWAANTRLSGGFSNAAAAGAPVDYGDYEGQSAYGGKFVAVWADNTNCDGSNPDGALHAFDLYMGAMTIPGLGGVTPTTTGTVTATRTATGTPTRTATASPAPTNTAPPTLPATGTRTPTPTQTAPPTATGTASATAPPATATASLASATPVPPSATAPAPTRTPGPPSPTATVCTVTYTDVDVNNPFYSYIHCLACRGIVSGYADGTFRPYNNITRAQIAKILVNAAHLQGDPGSQAFADVPAAHPFYSYINTMSLYGYISGYTCGGPGEPCDAQNRPYFRPASNATRGQIAKMAANAAQYADPIPATRQTYTDVPASNAFWLWIERLTAHNVIGGYVCGGPGEPCDAQQRPYFRPFNPVTRGQASKIVSLAFFPDCQATAP
jgi:hypothetical protein